MDTAISRVWPSTRKQAIFGQPSTALRAETSSISFGRAPTTVGPVIGYGANYVIGTEIHASRGRENMEQPAAFWVPSIGISGLAFYDGDEFPNWRGNAFVGGLSGNYQRLVRISLNGQTVLNREPMLVGAYRIRDVRVGPDGLVYIATDNIFGQPSEIIRLEPTDE